MELYEKGMAGKAWTGNKGTARNLSEDNMERTRKEDIAHAFRNWVSLVSVKTGNNLGEFRLGYDGFGRYRIEQIINKGGAIHVVSGGMSAREFVDAIYFMENSLAVKNNPKFYVEGNK